MNIKPNTEPPQIMHIDLNSAFAMTEQQANPFLRGRPVGITNRINDFAICITSSYEAKRQGIVIGTRQREARWRAPNFVMIESDAEKYRYVHRQLRGIFESYSPVAYMKSIDEGVIDFHGMGPILKGRKLEEIALEIKQRIKEEIGDYMTVNIGIGQNRWLAKVAASFNKPDGLLVIAPGTQDALFATMQLTDLPYINNRYKFRLNEAGIYTPLEFYQAPYWVLFRRVFKSVLGHHWYLKLRGYETEPSEYGIRSVGRDYVLEHRTNDPEELSTLFHKASVKVSRRLYAKGLAARGMMMSLRYSGQSTRSWGTRAGWFQRQMWNKPAWRADQLFDRTMALFTQSPPGQVVIHLSLTAYQLQPRQDMQPTLFEDQYIKRERLEQAIHQVNDRYGELTLTPAAVAASKNPMKDKIPFGTVRYFE